MELSGSLLSAGEIDGMGATGAGGDETLSWGDWAFATRAIATKSSGAANQLG